MNDINNYYLSMLRGSIMWLEKYIEVAQYYPDWKQRKQTDTFSILWVKENTPKSKVLHNVGTHLMLSFEAMLDEEPLEFREELKQEFYKWLDTSKINTGAPVELKCALFDFHEILECRFEKARKDRADRKRKIEIDSPEYMEKMQEVFQKSQEAIESGKVDQMDDSQFNGNPQKGKITFDLIANSLTLEEKENFHFWPQMTDQEKAEQDHKNKERINQTGEHPILRAKKDHALKEITQALNQETQITNNYLELKNQNWKTKIEEEEDIIKIANIQKLVLADIKVKRQFLSHQEKNQKITKTFLIAGGIFIGLIFITVLIFYYQKKNEKRK